MQCGTRFRLRRAGTPTHLQLQYVAGHDNIKTAMRYVHPQQEAVEQLFVPLGRLKRGRRNGSGSVSKLGPGARPERWMYPSLDVVDKLLKHRVLLNAEVVELADTPS